MFNTSVQPIDKTLSGATNSAQSGPVSDGNEVVLSIALWSNIIVIYEALCFDVAQGRLNGAPNETRIHSYRFASQAY